MPTIHNRSREAGELLVLALHCSGASGRQWRSLAAALDGRCRFVAPDLIGNGGRPHWGGPRPFRLADEARAVVALVDAHRGPVHLAGHSYGGAVALRVAVERPHRIAGLSLYEPTAFHVLRASGGDGRDTFEEILEVARDVAAQTGAGAPAAAARRFVDYWNGPDAFDALKPQAKADLVRYVPKALLDFEALFGERTPLAAYARLRVPLLLVHGSATTRPAETVSRRLAAAMNRGALRVLDGAGHMGPLTHADAVADAFASHILGAAHSRKTVRRKGLRLYRAA